MAFNCISFLECTVVVAQVLLVVKHFSPLFQSTFEKRIEIKNTDCNGLFFLFDARDVTHVTSKLGWRENSNFKHFLRAKSKRLKSSFKLIPRGSTLWYILGHSSDLL